MKASSVFLLLVALLSGIQASYFSDGTYQTIGSKYVVSSENHPFEWRGTENATQVIDFNVPSSNIQRYLHRDFFDREDDCYYNLELGFDILYFGTLSSEVLISSNGFLLFPSPLSYILNRPKTYYHTFSNNTDLNFLANVVAPFWDDLYLGDSGRIYFEIYEDEGSRKLVVTWENLCVMDVPSVDKVSFQVIFEEGSGDILFNYKDVDLASLKHYRGASATVGMTNIFGTGRTLYSFDEPSLSSGQSIRFKFEFNEQAPYFMEIKPTRISGKNQVEVKVDYAGLLPTSPAYLFVGTEPSLDDLGRVNLYDKFRFRDNYIFQDLPSNPESLYLTLNAECYTGVDDGYVSLVDFLTTGTFSFPYSENDNLIYGKVSAVGLGNVQVSNYNVQLWSERTDGYHIVAEHELDEAGSYRFSNIPQGNYHLSIQLPSQEPYIISPSFFVDVGVVNKNLEIISSGSASGVAKVGEMPSFFWRVPEGTKSFSWHLYDSDGIELLRYDETYADDYQFSENETVDYQPNYDYTVGEYYNWDISGFDADGNVIFQKLNQRFFVKGGEQPKLFKPEPGSIFPHKRSLSIGFYLGTIPVDEWKIELSGEKDGAPFWESSRHFDGGLYFEEIPKIYKTVHVKISYKTEGVWNYLYSYCTLANPPDFDVEMLSPLSGVLKKNNQEFVFRFVGEAKELFGSIYEVDILSENGVEFDSDRAVDWGISENGDELYTSIGVLPTSGEDLTVRVRYAEKATGVKTFPLRAYFGGYAGQQDYAIDDTVSYNWVDGTLGKRLDLKGSFMSKDISLPFTFNFYGQNYDFIRVKEEGYATFSSGCETFGIKSDEGFPDSRTPNSYIAPLRSSTDLSSGGGVFVREIGEAPNRKFVIEWNEVGLTAYPRTREDVEWNNVTFQMVLHEGTNEITFQYKDVIFDDVDSENNYGKAAFVGIENQNGSRAAVYSEREAVLREGLAILISPL